MTAWLVLFALAIGLAALGARPAFRSPLHRLYGLTLYRIPWVQRLNTYLDRLAGKR